MEETSSAPEESVMSTLEQVQDGTDDIKQRKLVRYRVEYRHPATNEVLSQKIVQDLNEKDDTKLDDPAFEIITTYKSKVAEASSGDLTEADQQKTPLRILSEPSYHIDIYSPAIINALRSVVKYYPSQDLAGDVIRVSWPYPVLVHHYDELSAFKDACAAKDPATTCERERDAPEHIGLLLKFLDEHVMQEVRAEQERNKRDSYTWEYSWVRRKPGTTFVHNYIGSTVYQACVIHSVTGGTFENPITPWIVTTWTLGYDGTETGRIIAKTKYITFDGEVPFRKHGLENSYSWDENDVLSAGDAIKKRYENGQRYWNLLRKQCRYYKGKTVDFPFNEVEGLVMVDPQMYYADYQGDKPSLMGEHDLRNWTSDCACSVCKADNNNRANDMVNIKFGGYSAIGLDYPIKPHQFLLFPHSVKAFVFATRSWEQLHVENFSEPEFRENMINNLVMDQERKATLKALSLSFARRNQQGDALTRDMWSADFVKGKGSGLIFLLHGRPGIGKTYTAECISAFTRRPLMILTSSDIGTDAANVENNLAKHFRTAKSWGVVLLIDEADVFMERRTSSDLVRNSLVAGFLRALEYYDGILFLTTNRVGSFDDAFISRIHVQLFYDDFQEDQRRQVWKTFVTKLSEDRGSYIRLNAEAKEYIYSKEVCSTHWNGREIKNAFQTAVALAEYHGRKDEEGTILVTDADFRGVVGLAKDFRDYLQDLHKGDESKRAERSYSRLDTQLRP